MNLSRLIRHLFFSPVMLKRNFPPASLVYIEKTIGESELQHRGEIRFAIEAALPYAKLFSGMSARARALEVFSKLRVWDTEENNGVLIYVLLADRNVEIIADRGIHSHVGEAGWESACQLIEAHFRNGDFKTGSLEGIGAVSEYLIRFYPAGEKTNPNELPDKPLVM